MVKIRLSRIGAKGQPYYRIIVTDSRKKRDGRVLENIGRYNPRTEPSTFEIDKERLKYWRSVGAQLTEPVAVLLGEVEPKRHQPKNVKPEVPATPTPVAPAAPVEVPAEPASETTAEAPAEETAGEPLPEPTPSEGAAEVKMDAPETTPEASPELAEAVAASESVAPEVTSDVIGQTVENTEVTGESSAPEQNQPSTDGDKAEDSEISQQDDNPEEKAAA